MTQAIGARLKALREQRGLSQEDMRAAFGFKDRQTVSTIETGERRLSADELLVAINRLGVTLEDLTDPFRLVGEGSFSWRQTNVAQPRLDAYERLAGRWVAAFRTIAPQVERVAPLMRRALNLTRHSRYEDAMAAGERFVAEFALGDVPAARLASTMEDRLGILVLMVDAFEGISGAACRLPDRDVVLINRKEVAGRRHFDLAHELFHLLTWEAMPPERIESAAETGGNRVEQLANNFASALLMPTARLDALAEPKALAQDELIARLNRTADELRVTASALKWRLVALGRLRPIDARGIPDAALRHNGRARPEEGETPPLFSPAFLDVLGRAIDAGRLSARRAADLVGLNLDDLADLFAEHGQPVPFEY